ncbi:Takeout, partial [Operophtera brumata]
MCPREERALGRCLRDALNAYIPQLATGDIDAKVIIGLGRKSRLNDVDALTCEHLDVKFHVGFASMQLENLFGGDGDLEFTKELQVPMEEALRDFLKPLADHAFATLDADDVLAI